MSKRQSQLSLLIGHLISGQRISQYEALGRYGIGRLSARILELRSLGFQIVTDMEQSRVNPRVWFASYKLTKVA